MTFVKIAAFTALLALPCSPRVALGVDGVIEINQASALAGGVTPGDLPGLPVTLSEAASYRLTSNLIKNETDDDPAIEVIAFDVTIDLNGFAMIGPAKQGDGHGILSSAIGTVVRNGSVREFGGDGIHLDDMAAVQGVHVRDNGRHGIYVGFGSRVTSCRVGDNVEIGIRSFPGALVADNLVEGNSVGIFADDASVVVRNTVSGSVGNGIMTLFGCVVRGNTAHNNGADGISAGNGCTAVSNVATDNGDDGIHAAGAAGTVVIDNVTQDNSSYGLNLSTRSAYGGNATSPGIPGRTVNSGVPIGANLCGGTTTCP